MRHALLGFAVILIVGAASFDLRGEGRAGARPARALPSRAAKPTTPAGYFQVVRTWHTPPAGKTPAVDASGRPKLVLHGMYIDEVAELQAASDEGGFAARDLDHAARVLREPGTGNEHPIEPRVLDVIYRIQAHFKAYEIRVMSAYRTPIPGGSSQGNHGKGRAVDFVVPVVGVSDQDVARFAYEVGFVGVGVYPVGSFVHVDVRDRSYFWVDRSGPGHRSRERGILLDVAQRADAEARGRGELAPIPFHVGDNVDTALHGSQSVAAAADENDEDEE